jgi:hypothetical protein
MRTHQTIYYLFIRYPLPINMRTSILCVLGAALSFSTLGTYADVVCNTNQNLHTTADELAITSLKTLQEPLKDLCSNQFGETGFLTYRVSSTVLTITRTNNTNTLDGCKNHFEDIVRQCTVEKGYHGGTVLADGVLYEVYHDTTYVETAGQGSKYDHKVGSIEAGSTRPVKRVTTPTTPKEPKKTKKPTTTKKPIATKKPTKTKKPTALKTPAVPKIPTTPKTPITPTTPKTTPKACPLKRKGKGGEIPAGKAGKRADTTNPDCEEDEDLATIWNRIKAPQKAKGDSAADFAVDPDKSDAWGVTYLYGCTAILISDPKFVIGKYCSLLSINCCSWKEHTSQSFILRDLYWIN